VWCVLTWGLYVLGLGAATRYEMLDKAIHDAAAYLDPKTEANGVLTVQELCVHGCVCGEGCTSKLCWAMKGCSW